MNPVYVCSCGRTYTALTWALLPLCGLQEFEWGEALEMRNCHCGSTGSITIAPGHWDESELDPRDPDLAIRSLMRRVA